MVRVFIEGLRCAGPQAFQQSEAPLRKLYAVVLWISQVGPFLRSRQSSSFEPFRRMCGKGLLRLAPVRSSFDLRSGVKKFTGDWRLSPAWNTLSDQECCGKNQWPARGITFWRVLKAKVC
jgi:hypothetical protein